MKIPQLGLRIISFNLENVFLILQGVSRYISSIILNPKLVLNEDIEVLKLLASRYPAKKVILDLSEKTKVDDFVHKVVKDSSINCFIISGKDYSDAEHNKLCRFLIDNKKEIILTGTKFDLVFLQQMQIRNVIYHRRVKNKSLLWTKNDFDAIQDLMTKGIFVTVGDITTDEIKQFGEHWIDEFLVSKEVCYSFNPAQTCKLLYSEIKQHYTSQ